MDQDQGVATAERTVELAGAGDPLSRHREHQRGLVQIGVRFTQAEQEPEAEEHDGRRRQHDRDPGRQPGSTPRLRSRFAHRSSESFSVPAGNRMNLSKTIPQGDPVNLNEARAFSATRSTSMITLERRPHARAVGQASVRWRSRSFQPSSMPIQSPLR